MVCRVGKRRLVTLSQGVGEPSRTTPLRIATYGDSTADFYSLTTNLDVSAWNVPFAAGTTQVTRRQEKTLVAGLYGQAFMVANGGVSGETTAKMLSRSSAGPGASRKSMEDVIALSPHVVLLRAGINSLTQGASAATVIADLKTIIDTFTAAGIWVVYSGIYGYSGETDTANVRTKLLAVNADLSAYSRAKYRYVDLSGVTQDGTGAYISGISADGTHLGNKGGIAVAKKEAAALRSIFGAAVGPRYAGTNVIPNADLSAFGSQSYGTVGTGWSTSATNGTRANAKIETIDSVLMQTVEVTPTANSCICRIYVPFGVYGASPSIVISAGQVYGFEADIYIAGLGGEAPPAGSYTHRIELFTGTPRNLYGPAEPGFTDTLGEAVHFRTIWEPTTIPDFGGNQANLTSDCHWVFTGTFGLSGDRTPFKIGVGNPRMVLVS